jgi:hypothetical protein
VISAKFSGADGTPLITGKIRYAPAPSRFAGRHALIAGGADFRASRGAIDVLVVMAGIYPRTDFAEMTL